MIKYILLGLLVSCGYHAPTDQCTAKGTKCHDDGNIADNTEPRGNQGVSGRDGSSCTTTQDGNDAEIRCTDGTVTRIASGRTGDSGPTGPRGPSGSSCSVQQVMQGAVISCTDGTSVLVLNGTDGQDGQDGIPGTAGTLVLPVRLCPGSGSHYPNIFSEVAFCLSNKLYAVYSANDGFLTEIPPGQYSSNAVGSTCNLTVLANCQIQ